METEKNLMYTFADDFDVCKHYLFICAILKPNINKNGTPIWLQRNAAVSRILNFHQNKFYYFEN